MKSEASNLLVYGSTPFLKGFPPRSQFGFQIARFIPWIAKSALYFVSIHPLVQNCLARITCYKNGWHSQIRWRSKNVLLTKVAADLDFRPYQELQVSRNSDFKFYVGLSLTMTHLFLLVTESCVNGCTNFANSFCCCDCYYQESILMKEKIVKLPGILENLRKRY